MRHPYAFVTNESTLIKQEPCPKLGPVYMEVGGPLVSEVTRVGGVTRLSILSLTLI